MEHRAQELCESRGGRPVFPVPNSLHGLCGRKAAAKERERLIKLLILNARPIHCNATLLQGAGIAQWLERRTRD